VNDELLRARLRETRVENLIILLVDDERGRTARTEWYSTPPGTLARRDAYSTGFLDRGGNRELVRATLRAKIATLCRDHRWRVLHWLHSEFPDRHLAGAPDSALQQVRSIIEEESRSVRVAHRTGWDQILSIPVDAAARLELAKTAAATISQHIRASFTEHEAMLVFPSAIETGMGMRMTIEASAWADGIVRYVVTLNRLRNGKDRYTPGTMPGATWRMPNHAVERATEVWNDELTEGQRLTLADDHYWSIVLPRIWHVVRERIDFGFARASTGRTHTDFQEGHFTHPGQDVW
jgi:hypothetical protein